MIVFPFVSYLQQWHLSETLVVVVVAVVVVVVIVMSLALLGYPAELREQLPIPPMPMALVTAMQCATNALALNAMPY